MNPQVEMINKVNEMYNSNCVCNYKENKYSKGSITLTHSVAFTNPTTQKEECVGYIHFGDEKLTKEVDVIISGDELTFIDRE